MLIRRRIWLYRLPGQVFAQQISFERPVTAATVRRALQKTVGNPLELWARGLGDPVASRS
ncbi:MAG: hypothetical protein HZA64_12845 [Rhodocyclales bacterium]|jgi:hypothetical protein|nr:hypothetical protein [Rhodocyclales bacterium]